MILRFPVYGRTYQELYDKANAEAERFIEGWRFGTFTLDIDIEPSMIGHGPNFERSVMEYVGNVTYTGEP